MVTYGLGSLVVHGVAISLVSGDDKYNLTRPLLVTGTVLYSSAMFAYSVTHWEIFGSFADTFYGFSDSLITFLDVDKMASVGELTHFIGWLTVLLA